MISGRQALQALEKAVATARQDEGRLDRALRSASAEAERLRAERMAAFRDLARIRLDELTRAGVVGELDAAERRAVDLLAGRRVAVDALNERRHRAEEAVEAAERERHARAAGVERALNAIEGRRVALEQGVRASPEWTAQRARADGAVSMADAAEAKAAQADADREEKRKPYEADPLFMYLWGRRFGTEDYRSGRLVRFFDRGVARLVGYETARANYHMLQEIPRRLREHAERLRADAPGERDKLAAIEKAALASADLRPLEHAVSQAKLAVGEAGRVLGEAKAALAALDAEHKRAVEDGDDAATREAVELLAVANSREDMQELYREAARTPTPRDEAVLRRIEGGEAAIARADAEVVSIRGQSRDLAARREAIERERDEFRRSGRDDPFATFGEEATLSSVLGGILGGLVQGGALRDVLNGGARQRAPRWDPDFGGGGGPSFLNPGAGGGDREPAAPKRAAGPWG